MIYFQNDIIRIRKNVEFRFCKTGSVDVMQRARCYSNVRRITIRYIIIIIYCINNARTLLDRLYLFIIIILYYLKKKKKKPRDCARRFCRVKNSLFFFFFFTPVYDASSTRSRRRRANNKISVTRLDIDGG